MRNVYVMLFALSLLLSSCEKGCKDFQALDQCDICLKDNGKCEYSRVLFYSGVSNVPGSNVPISKIEMRINGEFIGEINLFPQFPESRGPGNCTASGFASFEFDSDRKKVDWEATIYPIFNAAPSKTFGAIEARSSQDCIQVDIWR
jgi:hypothetical protein